MIFVDVTHRLHRWRARRTYTTLEGRAFFRIVERIEY
jgi:hypothetical protein